MTTNARRLLSLKDNNDSLERLQFYVLVCPKDILKFVTINCKMFG